MHPEMVASYIAKYATKAAEDFGLAPQRIHPLTDLDSLPVSEHVRRHLATAVQIGSAAAVAPAPTWTRLTRWLHMLGFRGHFATKMPAVLGHPRPAPRRTPGLAATATGDPPARPRRRRLGRDDPRRHRRLGVRRPRLATTGDAALAASAAARAREHREFARSAAQDHDDI